MTTPVSFRDRGMRLVEDSFEPQVIAEVFSRGLFGGVA